MKYIYLTLFLAMPVASVATTNSQNEGVLEPSSLGEYAPLSMQREDEQQNKVLTEAQKLLLTEAFYGELTNKQWLEIIRARREQVREQAEQDPANDSHSNQQSSIYTEDQREMSFGFLTEEEWSMFLQGLHESSPQSIVSFTFNKDEFELLKQVPKDFVPAHSLDIFPELAEQIEIEEDRKREMLLHALSTVDKKETHFYGGGGGGASF